MEGEEVGNGSRSRRGSMMQHFKGDDRNFLMSHMVTRLSAGLVSSIT